MKQLLQSYRRGEIWLADVPVPAPGAHGLIVRTSVSVVSTGTEKMVTELARRSLLGKALARPDLVHTVLRKIKTEGLSQTLNKVFSKLDTPIPLGYSCSGTVVEVGRRAQGFSPGDRVACSGSGYATHAEFNYVPENLCVRMPEGVSMEEAAFGGLGAIAMQGVRQAEVHIGESVAVIGLGVLGMLTAEILKAAGCRVIGCDIDPERCARARELGVEQVVRGDELLGAARGFTGGHGVDAVVITAATPSDEPLEWSGEIVRQRGRVVAVGQIGMKVPRDVFYRKELELRLSRSTGPGRYDPSYEEHGLDYPYGYVRWTERRNMGAFLELVASGGVRPAALISDRFPIDRALEIYRDLLATSASEGRKKPMAVVIEYEQEGTEAPIAERKVEIAPLSPATELGVGVIGAGRFAEGVLIPAISRIAGVRLVGLCSARGRSAVVGAGKHGFSYATSDYRQLLEDDAVKAVFIATRHDSHALLAGEALRAGKHVYVEKPLALDPHELDRLEKLYADLGRGPAGMGIDASGREGGMWPLLMVGYNRRFSSHALLLKEKLRTQSGPMFINYRVSAGRADPDDWVLDPEEGGGRIVGEACHFVDFCLFVTGARVTRVAATRTVVEGEDSRDYSAGILLQHADGSLSSISYITCGSREIGKELVEVFCGDLTGVNDDFRSTRISGGVVHRSRGQDKGHHNAVQQFLECIRTGGRPPISFADLIHVSRVTMAVLESLRTGRMVTLGESATQ